MTYIRQVVSGLLLVALPVALLWAAANSLLGFYRDGPLDPNPPLMPLSHLLLLAANASVPGAIVLALAAIVWRRSGSRAPSRVVSWLAGLVVGLALEHVVIAAALLARGVRGWEGAIVVSAPVYVIAELAIGRGALRGQRWALAAIVVAALPILAWTAFIAGILADIALRTPTFAPGLGAQTWVIFALLIVVGWVVGRLAARRIGPAQALG